jgi:Family of unknown function (DUF6580)
MKENIAMAPISKLLRASPVTGIELALVAGLIGLDIVARLAPHAPNFTPVAASALFAGMVLRSRALALLVPVLAMALSDLAIGGDDWRIMGVIYAALLLPAGFGMWARRLKTPLVLAPLVLASSCIFFISTNFAVWAFSGMYAPTVDGLARCYIAALPFFQYTALGDIFWTAVLFGGFWLARSLLAPAKTYSGAQLAAG